MCCISDYLLLCVLLFSVCYSSDVFHEGSKITFHSNNQTDFFGYSVVFGETRKALPNATRTVSREKFYAGVQIPLAHYFQITNAGPSDWPELTATILVSGKGSPMLKDIAGCAESWDSTNRQRVNLTLSCSWPVKAKQSLPVVLSMAYDLAANGKSLEADTTCNITSTLFLDQQNINLTLTTVLVLEPARMLWIPIIVAIIVGLLLVALISYTLYKCGFFSRAQSIQASQDMDYAAQLEEPSCSSSPSSPDPAAADNSKEDLMKPSCSINSHAPGSTVSNYFEPSELDNSLPTISFQGLNEADQNGEIAQFSSEIVSESKATALYK